MVGYLRAAQSPGGLVRRPLPERQTPTSRRDWCVSRWRVGRRTGRNLADVLMAVELLGVIPSVVPPLPRSREAHVVLPPSRSVRLTWVLLPFESGVAIVPSTVSARTLPYAAGLARAVRVADRASRRRRCVAHLRRTQAFATHPRRCSWRQWAVLDGIQAVSGCGSASQQGRGRVGRESPGRLAGSRAG